MFLLSPFFGHIKYHTQQTGSATGSLEFQVHHSIVLITQIQHGIRVHLQHCNLHTHTHTHTHTPVEIQW